VRDSEDALDLVQEPLGLVWCPDLVQLVDADEDAAAVAVQVCCDGAGEVTELADDLGIAERLLGTRRGQREPAVAGC
jgi:hypothetical protein